MLAGVGLFLSMAGLGFARVQDAAKTALWWFVLGGSVLALCQAWSARAAGGAWLLLCVVFGLDAAVQGVVRGFFGAQPQPGIVAEALANTTMAETLDFMRAQRGPLAIAGVYGLLWGALGFAARPAWQRAAVPRAGGRRRLGLTLLSTLAILLHLNPTMLRSEPFLRWGVLAVRHHKAQGEMQALRAQRESLWARRSEWQVQRVDERPSTVVVFIGESANRANWGLYGYPRDTTGPLADALRTLGGQTLLFTQARAAAAFTLPALRLALTPASAAQPGLWRDTPDVVMLARAAGTRVLWLSNQPRDDGWIASLGHDAHAQAFVNAGNWRDSSTVDADLLPELRRLLAAPASAHELVVVHLLGQHFHYALRCGGQDGPFAEVWDDAVQRGLRAQGRSAAIQRARNAYDDATWCGARALAQMLQVLARARPGRALTALYFSDHGQEVGHTRDFAGHSAQSESGYTVPLWIWRSPATPALSPAALNAPIDLDLLDQALLNLLGLRARWYDARLDFLSRAYRPTPPAPPADRGHAGAAGHG